MFVFNEFLTLDQVEESSKIEGLFLVEKFKSFSEYFLKAVENYDEISVSPDIASLLNITGYLEAKSVPTDEYYVGSVGNKQIYVFKG